MLSLSLYMKKNESYPMAEGGGAAPLQPLFQNNNSFFRKPETSPFTFLLNESLQDLCAVPCRQF